MTMTVVSFVIDGVDFEYMFAIPDGARSFAEEMQKKHGVEVEIYEKNLKSA